MIYKHIQYLPMLKNTDTLLLVSSRKIVAKLLFVVKILFVSSRYDLVSWRPRLACAAGFFISPLLSCLPSSCA